MLTLADQLKVYYDSTWAVFHYRGNKVIQTVT